MRKAAVGFVASCLTLSLLGAQPEGPALPQAGSAEQVKLPPGVSRGWWSEVQTDLRRREYDLAWADRTPLASPEGAWQAANPAQGFTAFFTDRGVRVARLEGEKATWEWGLELARWGREGSLSDLTPARPSATANRVEFNRGPMKEWFLNDPRGLEHGFTIHSPPPVSGVRCQVSGGETGHSPLATRHWLTLDLALSGTLHPVFAEDGQAVDFFDGGNVAVLRYAKLVVTDAAGRVLPSHFEGWAGIPSSSLLPHPSSASGGLRIAIDDTGALYPITVDPLATSPAWTATGEATSNYFSSVASAGDVNADGYSDVIVGACGHASYTGKTYLYLGGPSGLSASPAWTAMGEATSNDFGYSVASAGDVNGDGYSDVVVGARKINTYTGKVYLYLGGPAGLTTYAPWTAAGEAVDSSFGCSVASAGDVNGDGYSDVLVGAYGYNISTGKAYLYLGGPAGLSASASWTALGEATNNMFGGMVASAGDINGDGYSDAIVGALFYGSNSGKAYLYLGGPSGLSGTASWMATGEAADNYFGGSVAMAGDVNGDGFSDVVVGAYRYNSYTGKAYLYMGGPSGLSASASWTATGEAANTYFGVSVASAGDVDGDGYSDVLVGAQYYSSQTGKAYLFRGGPSGPSASASWMATGEATNHRFGSDMATAGDVNGDGYSDILVAASAFTSYTGKAYLYLGGPSSLSSSTGWTADGEGANHDFGFSVSSAGDVNGDGYSDVIVGAYGYSSATGKAYLFLGGPSGLSASATWTALGEAASNDFGFAVASAGDVNGDGYSDVIVGAYGYSSATGRAYLFLGGPSGLSASASWTAVGQSTGDYLGVSVSMAGDVNGDGYSDAIVGAYRSSSSTGKAYLYLGGPSGLSSSASWTATGEAASNYFGRWVGTVGDVNGDGYADVIAGAYGFNSVTGKAYLYLGGPSGLSATPSWTATGQSPSSYFGYAAAGGDVNGDSYSDVLIGAMGYTSSAGRTYIYLGGASGLSASASWTATGEAANDYFGRSVAVAGDVNADGFSDVLVGADGYSGNSGKAYLYLGSPSGPSATSTWGLIGGAATHLGAGLAAAGDVNGDGFSDALLGAYAYSTSRGRAYLCFGGGGAGVSLNPRQRRADGTTPIAPLGLAHGQEARLGALLRSPFGRGLAQLEWQTAPLHGSLGQTQNPPQHLARWWDSGLSGLYRAELADFSESLGPWIWRVRVRYNPATTTLMPHSRWLTLDANGLRETDLRSVITAPPPPCVLPDEPCWLYSVVKAGTDYTLNWQDPNQSDQRTGWNVRRSNDPSLLPKSAWPLVGSNVVDMDAGAANYQWTDHSGADPSPGTVWYYQVAAYNANCPAEGPF